MSKENVACDMEIEGTFSQLMVSWWD